VVSNVYAYDKADGLALCTAIFAPSANRGLSALSLTDLRAGHFILKGLIVMPRGIPVTPEQEAGIIRLYQTGQSQQQVAVVVHLSQGAISNVLRRNGIQARSVGRPPRKYHVNHTHFEHINTPDRAYWLGFIAADGCVYPLLNQLSITLTAGDAGHLQKFLDCLDSDYPIHPQREGKYARVCITSAQLVHDLIRHGVVPRKSLILKPPDFLPDELWPHYWRGVFDGDGTICKNGKKWRVGWCGTRAMMKAVRTWVQTVSPTKAKVAPNSSIFRFEVNGTHFPLTVANALYQGSTDLTRLNRKYEFYLQVKGELEDNVIFD